MFVGNVHFKVFVAECALVVVDANWCDLVVEFASWKLSGRLDCLWGIFGLVRVINHAISYWNHFFLWAAFVLPSFARLVIDGFEFIEDRACSLLGWSSGHKWSLHHIIYDGHALGVDSVRISLPLSLWSFRDNGLSSHAFLSLFVDISLFLLYHFF